MCSLYFILTNLAADMIICTLEAMRSDLADLKTSKIRQDTEPDRNSSLLTKINGSASREKREKLSREKTFNEFHDFTATCKSFSTEF